MNSKFNLLLLAVMLAAVLPLCVLGARLADAPTDLPPDEMSGEKEEEDQKNTPRPEVFNIINIWEQVLSSTNSHKKKFEIEFSSNVEYALLNRYKLPSVPGKKPNSSSSKEVCFQWLAKGLMDYKVLLKYVVREYPNSPIVAKVNAAIPLLIAHIKAKMRNADQVVAPTSSEEQQWLKKLDNPDLFHRKMMAHSILRSLNFFLVDGKRLYSKWEMPKGKPRN
ncbi:interleukin-6-like [Cyprinodon tularosa]|uniref:interleukin-6-like n=1 Tax=Cyprinodon tularosa TaxID=77115 RepID=UPI0018E24051|nr:interleukin-6-like [Cyprinodon tularosa]